jgi:hypothetical protein
MKQKDGVELKCPHCGSEDFERIMSAACHSMGSSSGKSEGASAQTRNCPSGSCTTYEIPGHDA